MEDLSTIIWTVVIVGAMIFNSVAKARRARAKGEQRTPQHDEAWPSIPWNNAGETDTAATKGPERSVISREPVTRGTATTGKGVPRSENETGAGQTGQTGQTGQVAMPKQPVPADFPAEYRNPEGMARKAPETKRKEPRTAIPGVTGADSNARQVAERHAGAKKNEAMGGAGRISPAEEPGAAEIAEEFDLRRAVIYSEILKPRFEE